MSRQRICCEYSSSVSDAGSRCTNPQCELGTRISWSCPRWLCASGLRSRRIGCARYASRCSGSAGSSYRRAVASKCRVTAAMTAKEQGETGSLLRMHYCVRLSSLAHDFLAERDEGAGHGRILRTFPDPVGRLPAGRPGGVRRRPESATWRIREVKSQRECALIRIAQESLGNEAPRAGKQLQPQTSEFAKYVIVFTTFLAADFADSDVLMSEGLAEPRRHWLAH